MPARHRDRSGRKIAAIPSSWVGADHFLASSHDRSNAAALPLTPLGNPSTLGGGSLCAQQAPTCRIVRKGYRVADPNSLAAAISAFGVAARAKLSNAAILGEPEEQLRAPLEQLMVRLADLTGVPSKAVVLIGETSLSDMKIPPDFAVSVHASLAGFIEVKAPGKGADPRKFSDKHDRSQWEKLRSLPNLIYV